MMNETVLTTENVNAERFGFKWKYQVEGQIYAQPLYMEGVSIERRGNTFKRGLFVATMHNFVYAFDADGVEKNELWKYNARYPTPTSPDLGQPVSWDEAYANRSDVSNITPVIGITSTPVIDKDTRTLYAVAMTKLGENYFHWLHAIDVDTGQPKLPPVRIEAPRFHSANELQRAALALKGGRIYIAFCGFADAVWDANGPKRPYEGLILSYGAIGSDSPMKLIGGPFFVVETTPDHMGGIWQSGTGPAVDQDGQVYFVTGNAEYKSNPHLLTSGPEWSPTRGTDFDESDVKLRYDLAPVNGRRVLGYYTPSTASFLNSADVDLGVGGVMLLPSQPGPATAQPGCPQSSKTVNLLAHGSKAGFLYLIDRDCMGGFDPHADHIPGRVRACPGDCTGDGKGCKSMHIHATPLYWESPSGPRVYTVCEQVLRGGGVKAFTITKGEWGRPGHWQQPDAQRDFVNGLQMSLSANGSSRGTGILWMIMPFSPQGDDDPRGWGSHIVDGALLAFDAENLQLLWNSESVERPEDNLGKFAKFNAPTIANGNVYVATFSKCPDPTLRHDPRGDLSCQPQNVVDEGPSYVMVYGLRKRAAHNPPAETLYMAWRDSGSRDEVFWSSTADGKTWFPQQKTAAGSSMGPSLAVLKEPAYDERVYMAWKGIYNDAKVWWETFDGRHWQPQQVIPVAPGNPNAVGSSVGPGLAEFKERLFAAWRGPDTDEGIWWSSFDGQQWDPQQKLPFGTTGRPALSEFNGRLYMVWKSATDDSIYCSSSDGHQWDPQRQIPGGSSVGPSLAVFHGKLYMAWKGSGDTNIWWSAFDGQHCDPQSWTPQKRVPIQVAGGWASTTGVPSLAQFNGRLYMAWKGVTDDTIYWTAFDGNYWMSFDGHNWIMGQTPTQFASSNGPALVKLP
jgi:hypothetical protein